MQCIFILLAVLPLLASCIDESKDGACPEPPPMIDNLEPAQILGTWYDSVTNFGPAKLPENERNCVKNIITFEDGAFYIDTTFKDPNGVEHLLKKKFVPVADKNRWLTYKSDGDGWKDHGWMYSAVAYEPESILIYGCKNVGDKHIDFYRVRSRSDHPSDDVVNKLIGISKEKGDDREFITYKHSGCD